VSGPTRKQIEQALTEWGEQYRATVRMDAVAWERGKQQMLRALAEKTGELHEGGEDEPTTTGTGRARRQP